MGDQISIVAVCTGNICRSPMAEGILCAMPDVRQRLKVTSAGTHALIGNLPSEFSVVACREHGIDISGHRARVFDENVARESDIIVCMEPLHMEMIISLEPSAAGRTYNLADFSGGKLKKIADPYGCSLREYRQCFNDILICLGRFLEALRISGGSSAAATGCRCQVPGNI